MSSMNSGMHRRWSRHIDRAAIETRRWNPARSSARGLSSNHAEFDVVARQLRCRPKSYLTVSLRQRPRTFASQPWSRSSRPVRWACRTICMAVRLRSALLQSSMLRSLFWEAPRLFPRKVPPNHSLKRTHVSLHQICFRKFAASSHAPLSSVR